MSEFSRNPMDDEKQTNEESEDFNNHRDFSGCMLVGFLLLLAISLIAIVTDNVPSM